MPRNVGLVPPQWFDDERIVYWYFLRMVWGGGIGTLRWTTHPADTLTLDLNNGEGEQVWDGTKVWTPGQFEQGDQSSLAVSDLTFGNADRSFTDMMNQFDYGVRGIPITVWAGLFTKEMTGTPPAHQFIDPVILFAGRGNRAEVGATSVHVSLRAFSNPIDAKYPIRRFSPAFGFLWIPKENLKIPFGAQTITLPTRTSPSDVTTPPGGGGDVPPPGGFTGPTGRMPVIPVGRPRGTPMNPAPRGGKTPIKVQR